MKIIYFEHDITGFQNGFRGSTSLCWVRATSDVPNGQNFGEIEIPESTYWALFKLNIIDSLQELPHLGILDAYEDALLLGSGLKEAADLFEQNSKVLAQTDFDWKCSQQHSPEEIEYRISVSADTLKKSFLEIAEFLRTGAKLKFDVPIWL